MLQQSEDDSSSAASPGAVYAIYMEDEEVWTGVDIDDDSTVDRQLYQVMVSFLREYFAPNEQLNSLSSDKIGLSKETANELQDQIERKPRTDSEDYASGNGELRMIPGGRYGCT